MVRANSILILSHVLNVAFKIMIYLLLKSDEWLFYITILLNCAMREIKQRSSVWGREDKRERDKECMCVYVRVCVRERERDKRWKQ